jgi:AsmA protein
MPRRRSRSTSIFLVIPLMLVALLALAGLAIFLFVDPNSFKPRIADAVRAATGRELALKGPITIALSLQPTLRASDVSFSNPPGFSRPQMATLSRVEAQLALWPLLQGRYEIIRLDLVEPDVSLETNAAGQTNWKMSPPARPAAAAPSGPPAAAPAAEAPRLEIATVKIEGGKLAWINAVTSVAQTIAIQDFEAKTIVANGPISAVANLSMADHKIALTAETGSLDRLLAPSPGAAPWPLQLVARVEGTRLSAAGSIDRPLDGRGYQLTLDANVPDLGAIGRLLGRTVPGLHDVALSAKISDASGLPVPTSIVAHAGTSDLGDITPGLTLDHLDVTAPGLDQPMHADIAGLLSGQKLHLVADLGPAAMLMPGSAMPPGGRFPIDISAEAAGATVSAKGGIANPQGLAGLDVAIAARVPDLAALSPLAGQPLPGLHNIALDMHVADGDGGYSKTILLRGLSLTGPDGDLAGDLTVGLQPRLSITGQLTGKKLDFDALLIATSKAASTPAPVPAPAAAAPAAGPRRVINDRPFNLKALSSADADLKLSVGEIRSSGVFYRDLSGHIGLDHGKLTLDPFAATLPGGKLDLRLMLDSTATPPKLILALSAPGLALKPLLTAMREPDDVTGTVELAADITAEGNSPHQLAATLSGKVGLVMPDGELDNVLLSGTVGAILRSANLPGELFSGVARTKIRCAAIRLDAVHGQANVNAFVLDTARALVQGNGVINLDTEVLALRLRPMLRTGGPGIVVPIQVSGRLDAPTTKIDSGGALQGTATGIATGLLGGLAGLAKNPAAAVTNAFVGERGGDACGPAISAARGARPVLKP